MRWQQFNLNMSANDYQITNIWSKFTNLPTVLYWNCNMCSYITLCNRTPSSFNITVTLFPSKLHWIWFMIFPMYWVTALHVWGKFQALECFHNTTCASLHLCSLTSTCHCSALFNCIRYRDMIGFELEQPCSIVFTLYQI